MGKGKPYSDAEIRPETPEILRHLEKVHYKSREWNRGVDVGNRGTGNVEIEDQYADDVSVVDTLPSDKTRRS